MCPEIILYFSMFASLLPGVMAKKSWKLEERIKQEIRDDYEDVDLNEEDFLTESYMQMDNE